MVYQLTRESIPVLARETFEPENEDKEIWQPKWNCFCCHDSGIVNGNLVRLVIPDYKALSDKRPLCQNCEVSDRFHSDDLPEYIAASHDYRFTREICKYLDEFGRKDWSETLKLWHEKKKQGLNPHAEALSKMRKVINKKSMNPDDVEF
ncbi:hypothetical protein [Floridanema evergladense]|uniref:Uncharacterized protein n=1 Tax=Floridaenema evergladense BLCC-F167 TaxID=3153639 RepID=A0ABV4WDQ5_9CYAN